MVGCGGGGSAPALLELIVSPNAFDARVNDSVPLSASGVYDNNTQKLITRDVAWNTSDATVATVSENGQFTALAPGRVEITATSDTLVSNVLTVNVDPVPSLPSSQYMPLAINNQWSYTGTQVTTQGVSTAQLTTTLRVLVSQQVVVAESVWYELLAKGSDDASPNLLYWRHDPEGLVRYDPAGTVPVMFVPADPTVGMTWADPEEPRITFEVESTTAYVQVPAGNYENCVKIVETVTGVDFVDVTMTWYKPGLGLVWTQYWADGVLQTEQKLTRFDPGI